jgi:hypothetical protein
MMRIWFVVPILVGLIASAGSPTAVNGAGEPEAVDVAKPMEYVRLYSDSTGASHFRDEELTFTLADFAPPAPPISVSDAIKSEGAMIISSPSGWEGDWHPTPQRQYFVCLKGQLQVEVSDGEVRTFGPGAVILVEDTSGKGHVSRVVGKERCYAVVMPLKEK